MAADWLGDKCPQPGDVVSRRQGKFHSGTPDNDGPRAKQLNSNTSVEIPELGGFRVCDKITLPHYDAFLCGAP